MSQLPLPPDLFADFLLVIDSYRSSGRAQPLDGWACVEVIHRLRRYAVALAKRKLHAAPWSFSDEEDLVKDIANDAVFAFARACIQRAETEGAEGFKGQNAGAAVMFVNTVVHRSVEKAIAAQRRRREALHELLYGMLLPDEAPPKPEMSLSEIIARGVELEDLRYLDLVARAGSYEAAAQQLGVYRSSVLRMTTRIVKRLRDVLDKRACENVILLLADPSQETARLLDPVR